MACRRDQFAWCAPGLRRAEDLLHRLASGKLVDELVEVADLLHEWVLDFFYADAADHAGDELPRRVQRGSFGEEPLEVRALLQLRVEFALAVAGQPAQDRVNLLLRPALLLDLADVERVHARDARPVDPMPCHAG